MRIIDALVNGLRSAAVYNPDVQTAPVCILWTDSARQWEAIVPRLRMELPEFFVLGDYDPENRTGPAIWLRCVIAGRIEDVILPEDKPPILYLPGASRQDLRAVENCPAHLKPLAELQYRGTIWSQINAKDWTILAFLKSDQGGLGIDVAQDNPARNAMQLALYRLLDENVDLLKNKHLDKDYFNTLLSGGDPVRDLLQWLDHGEAFRERKDKNEWTAFNEVCKSQLGFDPESEGPVAGAGRLALNAGPWRPVWERFCEAPNRYPNIPSNIRKCRMPELDLFSNSKTHGSWPQWNESQERRLRQSLHALSDLPAHKAREKVVELETRHRDRRKLVWAETGESPLALALKHLAILAEHTKKKLAGGGMEDMAAGYASFGWKADAAVLNALSFVDSKENLEAMTAVVRAVYLPWIEESALYLQRLAIEFGYPGGDFNTPKSFDDKDGTCLLFVDGLRFDLAKKLSSALSRKNCKVEEKPNWAALPSVTATGKPAVSPVAKFIGGRKKNPDFEPSIAETEQSLKGGYHFGKLLGENGWTVLGKDDPGDGKGRAWREFGDIDREGHERGWKIALNLERTVSEIRGQIEQLFASGWKTVRVVTDHGWLLMPGGLPKVELPAALVESKWGRCASIKEGALAEENLYPWHWNPNHHFALASGIACYKKGEQYAHGGLSLQECLTLELAVLPGKPDKSKGSKAPVEITDVAWKGLRCKAAFDGDFSGLSMDIRIQPGNPSTSVVMGVKPVKENGTASVVIEKEELDGAEAFVVVLDENNGIVAQSKTVVGGDSE